MGCSFWSRELKVTGVRGEALGVIDQGRRGVEGTELGMSQGGPTGSRQGEGTHAHQGIQRPGSLGSRWWRTGDPRWTWWERTDASRYQREDSFHPSKSTQGAERWSLTRWGIGTWAVA